MPLKKKKKGKVSINQFRCNLVSIKPSQTGYPVPNRFLLTPKHGTCSRLWNDHKPRLMRSSFYNYIAKAFSSKIRPNNDPDNKTKLKIG